MEHPLLPYKELFSLTLDQVCKVGTEYKIPLFSLEHLKKIIRTTTRILSVMSPLVRVHPPAVIVGDIHGNFHDLLRIIIKNGLPPATTYVFLGDYVDRGEFSIEVITLLLLMKSNYPHSVTLLRGNHEFRNINKVYGFSESIHRAYGECSLWEDFNSCFDYMPFAAVIGDNIFCVHGGISPDLCSLTQIRMLKYPIINDDDTLIQDLVWSDPSETACMFEDNARGIGHLFGFSAVQTFYENTQCSIIIRAHECVNGVKLTISKHVYTVFSSSDYDTAKGNSAGFLIVQKDMGITPRFFKKMTKINYSDAVFFDVFDQAVNNTAKPQIVMSLCKVPSKLTRLPSKTYFPSLGVHTFIKRKSSMQRIYSASPIPDKSQNPIVCL